MQIEDVFKTHGAAIGLEDNPVQRDYAAHIAEAIATARAAGLSGQVFAEAETGVGKTIGYLVAAGMDCVANNARAIVSTHTISLQQQIMGDGGDMSKALRIIEAATGKRLTAALRIGMRNFVDTERALKICGVHRSKLLARNQPSQDDLDALLILEDWAQRNPGGDLRGFLEQHGMNTLPCDIPFDDIGICSSTTQTSPSWQAYQLHVAASRDADIVVTNHAMLIANARQRGRLLHNEDDPRNIGALIVDECDRLPDAAQSFGGDLLPIRDFARAAKKLAEAVPDAQRLVDALYALNTAMAELNDAPDGKEGICFWDDLSLSDSVTLLRHMEVVREAMKPVVSLHATHDLDSVQSRTLDDLADYAGRFLPILHAVKKQDGANLVKGRTLALRWSPDRNYPSFRLFRLFPARMLKALWQEWVETTEAKEKDVQDDLPGLPEAKNVPKPPKACCLVLTSATISTPGSTGELNMGDVRMAYGIWEGRNACAAINARQVVFSPKKFGKVRFVFSDPSAPRPYIDNKSVTVEDEDVEPQSVALNPAWADYAAHMTQAAMARGGRVLVLCTSFKSTVAVCDALRARLSPVDAQRLIEHTRGTRLDGHKAAFAASTQNVLITPSAWEGFDIRNQAVGNKENGAIPHVIIAQIPYAPPDGAVDRALERYLINHGKERGVAHGVVFNNNAARMLRKLRQAFGRGIRRPSDSFTCWLADPRFPRSRLAAFYAPPVPPTKRSTQMKNAFPKRFRNGVGKSGAAWDEGSMFMADGRVVEHFDMDQEMRA